MWSVRLEAVQYRKRVAPHFLRLQGHSALVRAACVRRLVVPLGKDYQNRTQRVPTTGGVSLPTAQLALILAFVVVLLIVGLHARIGKGQKLAASMTKSGVLAVTVLAFFRLVEHLTK